jgi:hypothetical protein
MGKYVFHVNLCVLLPKMFAIDDDDYGGGQVVVMAISRCHQPQTLIHLPCNSIGSSRRFQPFGGSLESKQDSTTHPTMSTIIFRRAAFPIPHAFGRPNALHPPPILSKAPRPILRHAPGPQRAPFSAGPGRPSYRQNAASLLRRWAARPTFLYEVGGVSGAAGLFYYSNLETVPMSGRTRFNVLSPEYEREMGRSSYSAIIKEFNGHILPGFAPEAQRVRRVLARLVEGLGKLDAEMSLAVGDTDMENWEVYVVASDQANAFVIPG